MPPDDSPPPSDLLEGLEAARAELGAGGPDIETEEAAIRRRIIERDQALAQEAAAAAVAADLGDLFEGESPPCFVLDPGTKTAWALRLLAAWTVGKPENADEVLQGHAVLTVANLCKLTGGR